MPSPEEDLALGPMHGPFKVPDVTPEDVIEGRSEKDIKLLESKRLGQEIDASSASGQAVPQSREDFRREQDLLYANLAALAVQHENLEAQPTPPPQSTGGDPRFN